MEIGLRAKVKPDVDDRAVSREASRLRESFEDAINDLEMTVDLSDVVDRVDDAQDHIAEMSDQTHRAATGAGDLKDAVESMDMSVLEELEEGDFGMDILFGEGLATRDRADRERQTPDPGMLEGVLGQVKQRSRGRTRQLAGGASEKLEGISSKLGMIGKGLLAGAAVVAIGGLALQFLSDTVDALASTSPLLETVVSMFGLAMNLFLRPIASLIGQFLLPLAMAALQLAAEFNTVFGEEGIGSALSFLAVQIITGLANTILTVDILGGLARLLFGGVAAKSLIARFLPQIGIKAIIAKLLPSIGVKAILTRIGLGGVAKLLTGRLAYFIPVIGQVIAVFDLLVYGITALIPGVEAFSPVMWALKKTFETLVSTLERAWLTFEWLGGKIADFGSWLASGEWLPDISIENLIAGGASVLDSMLGVLEDIWGWFLSVFQSVIDFLQPVFFLLGIFAAIGLEVWDALLSFLDDPVGALKGLFEGALELGQVAIDNLIEGTIDLWEWLKGGVTGIGMDLWEWLKGNVAGIGTDLWEWLKGNVAGIGTDLWDWLKAGVTGLGGSLWEWLKGGFNVGMNLWDWLKGSVSGIGASLWGWLKGGFNVGTNLWEWLKGGVTGLGQELWDWITEGAVSIGAWFQDHIPSVDQITSSVKQAVPSLNDIRGIIPGVDENPMSSGAQGGGGDEGGGLFEGVDWGKVGAATVAGGGGGALLGGPFGALLAGGFGGGTALYDEMFASGGIVTGPTTALLGEGGESEAVIPLSRLESMMSTPTMPSPSTVDASAMSGPDASVSATVDVSSMGGGDGGDSQDLATELRDALGAELDQISSSVDELARKIQNSSLNGPITITADGKVLAEVDAKGNDKYKRTRDVTK